MKKAILVHGWDGTPETGWFPWLAKELEGKGFEVVAPQLPESGAPRIEKWVPTLASCAGTVDEHTYFVGHSLGCQTIARYLETLPNGVTVGGVVYVAGFFKRLTNLEGPEAEALAEPWLQYPPNLTSVKAHSPKTIAFFSDDDPWVPLDNTNDVAERLDSEIIIKHGMSHFNEGAGYLELPIVLDAVLKLAQS